MLNQIFYHQATLPVADMGALIVDARMLEPGDEASLRVWRSQKLMLLTVKVGELD